MSLVNVFATFDRVVILSDTSLYDAAGRVMGFSEKCYPVDSWTGAFTFRGNVWGAAALAHLVERFASFDEFVAGSAAEIEREHCSALAEGRLLGQTLIELHVAGWSEREDRARSFVMRSPGLIGDPLLPYAWNEITGSWHLDFDLLALWRLARQGVEPEHDWTAETFDPHRHAVPLAEEQRRLFADGVAEFAGLRAIGGSLYATTVTREGVTREKLKDWPDAAGEPIQPTPWDHAAWPERVPCGIEWPFAKFQQALGMGVFNIKTFEVNDAALGLLEALEAKEAATSVAPPQRDHAAEKRSRKQERRAAQARRGPAHV